MKSTIALRLTLFAKTVAALTLLAFLLQVGITQTVKRPSAKPKRRTPPAFSTAPFDSSVEKLPPNYLGHSMIDVWAELYNRRSKFDKNEYETSDAWATRLQKMRGQPLTGSLTMLSQFAFRAYDVEDEYDADAKTLLLSVSPGSPAYDQVNDDALSDYDSILWWSETEQAGSFVGSNAFGVKRRVRSERERAYFTVLKGALGSAGGINLQEVSVERAKLIRPQIRVLIVGKLQEPYVGGDTDFNKATIDDPVQTSSYNFYIYFKPEAIWFYNLQSGDVYHRALIPPN